MRDLKNNLRRYLDRVAEGDAVIVTERGRPVARLAIDTSTARLAELVAAGVVRAPTTETRTRPEPIDAAGTVSDLVAAQRR